MDTTHTIPSRLLSRIHQADSDVKASRVALESTIGTVKDAVLGDIELAEGTQVKLDLAKGVFIVTPPAEAPKDKPDGAGKPEA